MATIENTLVAVLQQARGILQPEIYESMVDSVLDVVEDAIESTDTQIDDMTIGNAIKMLRKMLGVEDNDDEEKQGGDDDEDDKPVI